MGAYWWQYLEGAGTGARQYAVEVDERRDAVWDGRRCAPTLGWIRSYAHAAGGAGLRRLAAALGSAVGRDGESWW